MATIERSDGISVIGNTSLSLGRAQRDAVQIPFTDVDFLVIYLLAGKVVTAAAFMIISNIYTTVAYFLHERLWSGIQWGLEPQK